MTLTVVGPFGPKAFAGLARDPRRRPRRSAAAWAAMVCRAVAADRTWSSSPPSVRATPASRGRGRPTRGACRRARRLLAAEAEVAVDFTRPDAVMANVRWRSSTASTSWSGPPASSARELEEIRALLGRAEVQRLRRAELRDRRRADAAVRRRGGPLLRRGRDHRAASRREGRRAQRHGDRHGRARSPPPARAIGRAPRRSSDRRERVAPTWMACGCTRYACRAWSPTKRCSSAAPDRRCRSDTTRWIGRRSCPASCSRSGPSPIGLG